MHRGHLGHWAGAELLGSLAPKLIQETRSSIHVIIPEAGPKGDGPHAEPLLYLPWELAHANGKPLAHHDVSLVLQVEGGSASMVHVHLVEDNPNVFMAREGT